MGRKAALVSGAALGATVIFAPAAQAGTDTPIVDTLEDVDENDGSCEDGDCTLRDAVVETNTNDGSGTITFASGLSGTITLDDPDGDIYINDELTITGPGANVISVSAEDNSRIFYVDVDGGFGDTYDPVSISGLTLTQGYADSGAAVRSQDTALTLADMAIVDNRASNDGGGVFADDSSLTLVNSIVSDNVANADDGSSGHGGGIHVYETLDEDNETGTEVLIQGSVISDNYTYEDGEDGGGVYLGRPDGDIEITASTFANNTATEDGGGVYVGITYFESDLTISSSTFSGNAAGPEGVLGDRGYGGGALIDQVDGTTLIENSTFSGNSAYYSGGGIYFGYLYDEQTTTIRNSTIVDNVAGIDPGDNGDYGGGGVYLYDDSDSAEENGPIELSSTIVANNSADEGADLGSGEFADGFETGFSLIESGSAARDPQQAEISEDPAGSNIFGADPLLGALASNGGPTQTHAPSLASPALDKGIANGLATEQRGLARTSDLGLVANAAGGDGTDIGSVEIQAADVEAQCQGQVVRRLAGGAGNDTITGTDAAEAIFGLAGDDTLDGAGGNDCVSGGDGNDSARGGAGKDEVGGDAGRDNAKGGPGKDLVRGGKGADRASGGGGKDKVKGNAGKDKLKGGAKNDKLAGAKGKDTLKGGGGKDRLKGGPGKDKLKGGGGKDRINCGGGTDKVTAQPKDKVSANCEKVVEPG